MVAGPGRKNDNISRTDCDRLPFLPAKLHSRLSSGNAEYLVGRGLLFSFKRVWLRCRGSALAAEQRRAIRLVPTAGAPELEPHILCCLPARLGQDTPGVRLAFGQRCTEGTAKKLGRPTWPPLFGVSDACRGQARTSWR